MDERALIVWNPHAGSAGQAQELRATLATDPRVEIYEPGSVRDAQARVALAVQHGVRLIVAAGGDGTVNSVINGLAQAPGDAVLGVLPLGTANDWCVSLGIPHNMAAAWDIIQRRRVRPLDVVELQTRSRATRFANIATGGNSHRVTEQITAEMKQRWGALCYIRGAVTILDDLHSFNVEVSFDDSRPEAFEVWNLIVANGRTSAGKVEVAPRARLDDGLLDVVIIQAGTVLDLADLSARYLFGDYIESGQVIYRTAHQVKLMSKPPLMFSLDGDLTDEQPMSFRCLPQAINVVVGDEYLAS